MSTPIEICIPGSNPGHGNCGGHIRELHLVGHLDWQNAIPDARLHAQWVTLLDRGDLTPVIPR